MTDKATVEIPSPVAGIVMALGAEAGQRACGRRGAGPPRRRRRGRIRAEAGHRGAEAAKPSSAAEAADAADLEPAAEGSSRSVAAHPPRNRPAPKHSSVALGTSSTSRRSVGPPRPPGEKPIASPAVRRRALEAGVDLRRSAAAGPAGRITHDDLDAFLRARQRRRTGAVRRAPTRRCRGGQGHRPAPPHRPARWPRRSGGSRISPMSRRSTSRRWRSCATTLNARYGGPAAS